MSAAAAAPAEAEAPKKGKKKLIIILAAVLVLVLGGGGGAFFMMKKKADEAAAAEEGEDGHAKTAKVEKKKEKKKADPATPPVFVPLDPFTVNLADREAERYAQIGITLEVEDAKTGDQIKAYLPAIRNNILMVLAHKTSAQLLERKGKEKLAREVRREALRAMGIEIDEDDEDDEEAADAPPKKKKKKKPVVEDAPIKQVVFANFIIQ